ncbi:TPA: entry exclusion protein [Escherichia coli]|nr:entry exclusion protein [Escherichia coli]
MKILAQIILVTMIQFLSCYLAEWGGSEIVAILLFVLVWQILFIYFTKLKRNAKNPSCISLIRLRGIC